MREQRLPSPAISSLLSSSIPSRARAIFDLQARILRALVSNLKPGGLLLIWHAQNNADSLDPNVDAIGRIDPSLMIKSHTVPHPKVFRWVSNRRIAHVLTAVIGGLTGRQLTRRCFTVALGGDPAQ